MKFIVGFILIFAFSANVWPQDNSQTMTNSLGIFAGPFLPSHISGVREILQVAGLRYGTITKLGRFEGEGWIANGHGIGYQSALINYRLDIPSDSLPVHALIGIHADAYRKANAQTASGGGWQVGGGAESKIGGPLVVRADFEYRFSPGESLLVLVSFMVNF